MADRKLTQLPILVSADTTDLVYVVDVSDTSESPQGTSKKTTVAGIGANKADLVNGKIPISQIPNEAINVVTYPNEELFPPVGAFNTIYIAIDDGVTAYWDGDEYLAISGENDFLTGGTASTVTGSAEFFNSNGDTFTVDGFAKLADTIVDGVLDTAPTSNAVFDALALKENLANKTNTFTPYDGTGTKYPTFDLANSTFINNAKLASQTGFVSVTDTVELSALTSTTLRIKATNQNGVFFSNGLNSPTAVYTDGFKTFPQTDYPLTQLVTATGTNVNVNPIVVDGLHIRFVGYNINGGVVSSATSFKNNASVAQLGYVAVQKSGSSVTFVGGIATGGINVFTQVYLSNTNSLVLDSVRLNSTVAIGLNSGTTLSNTAGVVNGASINWHQDTNNPNNTNSINERSVQSNTDLPFFSIDATTASATTTPVPLTSWTQTVNGIAVRDSFYNSTTGQRDTLNNNTFSVKQLLLSQAGRFYLKEGVHTSAAGYASMDIAKASLPTAVFPVNLLPAGTNVEIGRIAFKKGFVNTTDVTEFVFYPTTAAGGGTSVVQTIADATTVTKGIVQLAGDISGTATNVIVTRVNNGTPYKDLATGLVKNTTGTGQHTIAIPDSDYATTGFVMSKIVQTITDGDTGHTPSADVIYDALQGVLDGTGTTGYIPQFTGGTSLVESQIFQHSNGNVSVGGTNPTAGKLEVIDTNNNPAYIVAASNDEFNYAGLQLTNVDYSQRWMMLHKAQAGVTNQLAFDFTTSAGTINAMNIVPNGNVLIGTTSDSGRKLQVNGAGFFNGTISTNGNTEGVRLVGNNLVFYDTSNVTRTGQIQMPFNNYASIIIEQNQHLFLGTDGQQRVMISNNGNVGIGELNNASQKLVVNGNVLANSFIKSGGTSTQFLKADGSVDSNTYALANTNGFIQNQTVSAQTASYRISGTSEIINEGITDTKALHITTITGLNNYSIYSQGGLNYFQGRTLIGTDTDFGHNLTVNGSTQLLGRVFADKLLISDNVLMEHFTNSDSAEVAINKFGFSEGTSFFRNFVVYDGKTHPILTVNGSTSASTFNGNVTAKAFIKSGATATNILLAGGADIPQSTFQTALKYYAEPTTAPLTAPVTTGANAIVIGSGAQANSNDMFVVGANAGNLATGTTNSNFIGQSTGRQVTTSINSNFIGNSAGYQASTSSNSNMIGNTAGYQANNTAGSNFFGDKAGYQASGSSFSIFIGSSAGQQANSSSNSVFIGLQPGYLSTGATNSVFIGNQAGQQSNSSQKSNFIGYQAGYQTSASTFSNFIGNHAGYQASASSYSNLFGYQAGKFFAGNAIGNNNIIIGTNISVPNAATNRINIGGVLFGFNAYANTAGNPTISNSTNGRIAINSATDNGVDTLQVNGSLIATAIKKVGGLSTEFLMADGSVSTGGGGATLKYYAEPTATPTASPITTGANSVAIGNGAQANSGDMMVFGTDAGQSSTNNLHCVFIGQNSGRNASNTTEALHIGFQSGFGASSTTGSIFLGLNAGYQSPNSAHSIFIGENTGFQTSTAPYSTFIGYQAGKGLNNSSNNIVIGTNVSLPSSSTNRINIGGLIFGFGTYSNTGGNPSTSASGGRVCINKATDNTVDTLQIGGTLNIGNITGGGASVNNLGIDATGRVVVGTSGGGGGISGSGTANLLTKWTSGSAIGNSQVFDNGTNVTIGSATDYGYKLAVDNGSIYVRNNGGLAIVNFSNGGGNFYFGKDTPSGTNFGIPNGNILYDEANNPFVFSNGTTEKMRLSSGGNLLIGTPTDNAVDKLQVNGSIRSISGGLAVNNTGVSGTATNPFYEPLVRYGTDFSVTSSGVYGGNRFAESHGTYLQFRVNGNAVNSPVNAMTIDFTGNISIGTPLTATQKLNIAGSVMSIDAKNQYLVCGMESDVAVLRTDWFSGAGGAARPMAFHTQGAERLRIATSGNVLIGTSTDNTVNTLQVNGTILATGGFFNSDARLKDIISRDGDVVTFKWKDDETNKPHVGYIAQEVQEIYPDSVQEDSEGMLSVNYVEVLIQKIAQLEKEIKELKSKIK